MGFVSAIGSGFKNCFKFTGRASRSEFWWFYLFFVLTLVGGGLLIAVLGGILTAASGSSTTAANISGSIMFGFFGLYLLAMFFPMLSLICRRLHDSDKSAFLVFLYLIPFGGLILFVFYCLPGTTGRNPHGDDPLAPQTTIASVF